MRAINLICRYKYQERYKVLDGWRAEAVTSSHLSEAAEMTVVARIEAPSWLARVNWRLALWREVWI